MNSFHSSPAPFSLKHVPFDFFPASDNTERKMRDWKLREAEKNNSELLTRAAKEADKARFAN